VPIKIYTAGLFFPTKQTRKKHLEQNRWGNEWEGEYGDNLGEKRDLETRER